MFNCEYCSEEACVELTEGKMGVWNKRDAVDCFVLKCHNPECGVQEPCDGDDLWGCLVQITGEDSYHKAMVKALQIVWKELHMKEVKE